MTELKSIVQDLDEPRCYVCGCVRNLELHHCMHGNANRSLADKYQLVVWLCRDHHTGRIGVHSDIILDERIKKAAQRAFEAKYGHGLWMKTFRKNYLDRKETRAND